jgi:hypothetical protein
MDAELNEASDAKLQELYDHLYPVMISRGLIQEPEIIEGEPQVEGEPELEPGVEPEPGQELEPEPEPEPAPPARAIQRAPARPAPAPARGKAPPAPRLKPNDDIWGPPVTTIKGDVVAFAAKLVKLMPGNKAMIKYTDTEFAALMKKGTPLIAAVDATKLEKREAE